MRFLVVGLGSMGKRRIRNLKHLGCTQLAGFDPREDRRAEAAEKYAVPTFAEFARALEEFRPDALIISTPPDLHAGYAMKALEAGLHYFCEASVVSDQLDALEALARARPAQVAAPSATFKFHPSIQQLKGLVDAGAVGKPLLYTYHSGQWLPDWHPWEDYRTFYVSRRETGACREIVPFELIWLTWTLGPIASVVANRDKVSNLDADIDDVYQVLIRHETGVQGHMLVDVVARAPVRLFRLCGQEGTLEWDGVARTLRVYAAASGEWTPYPEPEAPQESGYVYSEGMYIEEMRAFLQACQGHSRWEHTLEQDHQMLNLLKAIEDSSDSGCRTVL